MFFTAIPPPTLQVIQDHLLHLVIITCVFNLKQFLSTDLSSMSLTLV